MLVPKMEWTSNWFGVPQIFWILTDLYPNWFGDPQTEMGINSPNQSDDEDNDAADAEEG